ncbi:hypothetical protein VM636_03365 [Streptomyces sp. SCSIO 75703]|uniref:hypothetical protein n=1 Tax=unclassified Streptomyces TaxID=2593676 RepID=UPI0004C163E7|nr:hypothetical protein [Streptomyces sp. NRRL F-5065]
MRIRLPQLNKLIFQFTAADQLVRQREAIQVWFPYLQHPTGRSRVCGDAASRQFDKGKRHPEEAATARNTPSDTEFRTLTPRALLDRSTLHRMPTRYGLTDPEGPSVIPASGQLRGWVTDPR